MNELIKYRDDIDWPLNPDGLEKLEAEGVMHSPTIYDGRKHHVDPETLNPFDGKVENQWRELFGVLQRRHAVRQRVQMGTSSGMPFPIACFRPRVIFKAFGITTPEQAAEAVRAEDPAWHPTHCRQWLHNNRVPLRKDLFTPTPATDFSRGPLPVAAVMDALPYETSPTAFAVKYHHGIIRPRALLERYFAGTVEAPDWFIDAVADLGITEDNFEEWFQYREPPHPSFGAMHAAVGGFSFAAQVLFDMDNRQEAIDATLDYGEDVSHARDTGGVHYWSDSHIGLNVVGLQAVRIELPLLVGRFGGDQEMAEELMARIVTR